MCAPTWEALLPELHIVGVDEKETQVIVHASVNKAWAMCPKRGTRSDSVHTYRRRQVAELPVLGRTVILDVEIRRWRCCSDDCSSRTFTEVIPGFIERRRRRTVRLQTVLTAVGMELGGQAGSRLARWLAMPTSGSTLLRLVRQYHPAVDPTPLVAVGIDDRAFRRGRQYGSILVDLEGHRPMKLLASRESRDVIPWLGTMSSPRVLTRDRSIDYQRAVSQAWPESMQVADRWHLPKNLHDALERVFASHRRDVVQAAVCLPTGQISRYAQSRWRSASEEARRHDVAKGRQSRHRRAHQLREAGLTIRQISKRLRISHTTVCSDLQRQEPAGPVFQRRRASILDPHVEHIDKRWTEGCTDAAQLLREVRALGYAGSRKPVYEWVALRRVEPAKTSSTQRVPVSDVRATLPAPRRLAWLIVQDPADLEGSDKH